MGFANNGQARLYFETFGPDNAPAVLLCGGTGRQLTDYDAEFCNALVAAGYRAIRFDSRDVGLSSSFAQYPANLAAVYRAALGDGAACPVYGLSDMAGDALAVLDAAGAERAHLVGRSLGGAVAQYVAITASERVTSLVLIMTNSRSIVADIAPATIERVDAEKLTDGEDYVARQLRAARANALSCDFDEARITAEAWSAWQRGVHRGAIARHFAVAISMPDLRARLAGLTVPAVVIHGAQDRTIPVTYAQETAAAIAGTKLLVIDEMGHDGSPRVRRLWLPTILETLEAAQQVPLQT